MIWSTEYKTCSHKKRNHGQSFADENNHYEYAKPFTTPYLLERFVGRVSLLGRVDHQARGELPHGVRA